MRESMNVIAVVAEESGEYPEFQLDFWIFCGLSVVSLGISKTRFAQTVRNSFNSTPFFAGKSSKISPRNCLDILSAPAGNCTMYIR